jgi:hypothetical protein
MLIAEGEGEKEKEEEEKEVDDCCRLPFSLLPLISFFEVG